MHEYLCKLSFAPCCCFKTSPQQRQQQHFKITDLMCKRGVGSRESGETRKSMLIKLFEVENFEHKFCMSSSASSVENCSGRENIVESASGEFRQWKKLKFHVVMLILQHDVPPLCDLYFSACIAVTERMLPPLLAFFVKCTQRLV